MNIWKYKRLGYSVLKIADGRAQDRFSVPENVIPLVTMSL